MKSIIHIACAAGLLLSGNCQAQDDSSETRTKELYVTTSGLTGSFGAEYKRSLNHNWFMRYTIRNLNVSSRVNEPVSTASFGSETFRAGLEASVGIERRKAATERLTLIGGGNFVLAGGYEKAKTLNPAIPVQQRTAELYRQGYGVSFHMGALYSLTDHLLLGAVYEPTAIFRATNATRNQNSFGYDIGFDQTAVKLMVGFRWNKLKNS